MLVATFRFNVKSNSQLCFMPERFISSLRQRDGAAAGDELNTDVRSVPSSACLSVGVKRARDER